MKRFLILFFLCLCQQTQAEILVSIDRDPVVLNESFQLIFESNERVKGQPDFSPLKKDFTILSNSSRINTNIINGKMSYSQQWILTVLPNKAGKINIPAIDFGKELSQPRIINVVANAPATKSNKTDDIFLEVKASTPTPYVQAQVLYTVKLYRAVPTNNASLSEPEITGGQAVINKLGDDKSYQTHLNGKRYGVIERRYVIFPQNSGQLEIKPLIFQAQTGTGNFFNFDPFGPQPRSIVKRSDALTLDVKPIPDAYTGKNWLPAKHLNIQEQWSVAPDKLKQGDAVTRTLTLTAEGLAASNLPVISDTLPDEFKHYPDQPEFEESNSINGFIGIRREKMAIIPLQDGKYTLPAIKIPWWNTETDKMEIAELPERSLTVQPSTVVTQTPSPQVQETIPAPVTTDTENKTITGDEVVAVQTEPPFWKWVSLGSLLLWLITVVAWWLSQRSNKAVEMDIDKMPSIRVLQNKFKIACRENDPVKTRQTLLDWANARWPEKHITNISQLKPYGNTEWVNRLEELNHHLYGKNTGQWNGSVFLKVFESQSFDNKKNKLNEGKLEPLYKT